MQSSFNVIKNTNVKDQGNRNITTSFENKKEIRDKEENTRLHFESYESLAKTLLENARAQSDAILSKAFSEAQEVEQTAKQKAAELQQEFMDKGYKEGHEQGYNKAYEETIARGQVEYEKIVDSINEMIDDANKSYEEYLEQKKNEILDIVITSVESILKKEVKEKDSLNNMIFEALNSTKNAKMFIIRCNSVYTEELKAQINDWREQLAFKGDIFVVKDNLLEEGAAAIDKGNGTIYVDIKNALQKLREILEGND